jgi:hypothetical protein
VTWRPALPELVIAAVTVVAAGFGAAAVAGWAGVVVVAAVAAVIAVLLMRGIVPRAADQPLRLQQDKQRARPIHGYSQRRYVVVASLAGRGAYESELRPVLEHVLAARLAENHAVNLYTEPDRARQAFCRDRGDASLWHWIDPAQALGSDARTRQAHGIPRRTLTRLVNRLEQL